MREEVEERNSGRSKKKRNKGFPYKKTRRRKKNERNEKEK